jgi:hypothetical protein
MEWISVEDKYPNDKQTVMIKIWDHINDCDCEVKAIFNDNELYRSWTINGQDDNGRNLIALPSHWALLSEPTKE